MKNRALNRMKAAAGGFFWLPCPLCGQEFGGHEWRPGPNGERSSIPDHPEGGGWMATGICPDCTAAGKGDEAWSRVGVEWL